MPLAMCRLSIYMAMRHQTRGKAEEGWCCRDKHGLWDGVGLHAVADLEVDQPASYEAVRSTHDAKNKFNKQQPNGRQTHAYVYAMWYCTYVVYMELRSRDNSCLYYVFAPSSTYEIRWLCKDSWDVAPFVGVPSSTSHVLLLVAYMLA